MWAAASRAVADRLLAGGMSQPPDIRLWDALLPCDRERLLIQQPRTETSLPFGPECLVADIMAERRLTMRLRTLRDAGPIVAMAFMGAAIAVYVAPPASWNLAGAAAIWLLALTLLARYAGRRARGQGVVGMPEGNALYHADPERFALGAVYGCTFGAGLGVAAMLVALVASTPW